MQITWQGVLTWLLVGAGFSLVVLPAIKYWMSKGYVEKPKEGHEYITKADLEAYRETIARLHSDVGQRVAELATTMQTYSGNQANLQDRVVELETKVKVFWTMIERSTADLLHRDDTPMIDRLLERLPAENLTPGERTELLGYLAEIEKSTTRPRSDRVAALILRASIEARYGEESRNGNDSGS